MLRRVPWRGVFSVLAVLATLMVLTSCASGEEFPQTTIDPAGEAAEEIQSVYTLVWWLSAVVFVLVEGALIFILFRYRGGKKRPNERPAPIHGNVRLEIIWTIIPAIILVVILVPTLRGIVTLSETKTGPDVFRVDVYGQQFFWQFEYPDLIKPDGTPVVTTGTMNIPVDRRVEIRLHSRDVIHSFWVPRLAGKTDVVPGNVNHMWLEADTAGTYQGQCAEFCGLSHANMRFQVNAMAADQFNQWMNSQVSASNASGGGGGETDLVAQGKQIVETVCSACHTVAGTSANGTVGPELSHFTTIPTIAGVLENNKENLRKWLENPPAVKPGTAMPNLNLSQEQIDALVAYLYTLK